MTDDSRLAVHIRSLGLEVNPETRKHMRKKINRRLGKFAEAIERVSIRFADVNGPKGGVDQICRLKVVLKNLPTVVVENQGMALDDAFSGALAVAERQVRRSVQRRRSKPIKKIPAPRADIV